MWKRTRTVPWADELNFQATSWAVWGLASLIGHSCRWRVHGYEQFRALQRQGGLILVTWHGRILLPIFLLRGQGLCAIASLSRDGELLHRVFRRFGGVSVRGSTRRHPVRALAGAVKMLRRGAVLSFTPDGPRGPAGKVQGGTLYLAQKARCPILPIGSAAWPCRRLGSWDRFLLPLPFARAAVIFGEPFWVPPEAPEGLLKRLAVKLEDRINEAMAWAEAEVRRAW
jgi:lysophospholipid acyltransferase (LPLAT)-like uncharacterized protein